MGLSPETKKIIGLVSTLGYLLMLSLMLGLQCAFPGSFEVKDVKDVLSLDRSHYFHGAFYAFSDSACTTNKVGFTIFYLLMLICVGIALVGMITERRCLLLVHAGGCLAATIFMIISFVFFIVKVGGLAGYWTFWRGLLSHILACLALVSSGVMSYFVYRGE